MIFGLFRPRNISLVYWRVHYLAAAAIFVLWGCNTNLHTGSLNSTDPKSIPSTTALQSMAMKDVCKHAIKVVNGVAYWESSETKRPYAIEAIRRKHTPEQCASYSGVTSLSGPASLRDQLWLKYFAGNQHKAVATASNGAFGAAWDQPTQERANDLAMELCLIYGGSSCHIIDVAN